MTPCLRGAAAPCRGWVQVQQCLSTHLNCIRVQVPKPSWLQAFSCREASAGTQQHGAHAHRGWRAAFVASEGFLSWEAPSSRAVQGVPLQKTQM